MADERPEPRDRKLDSLSDEFRPKAFELIARLVEANIPVLIVETRRTAEQHAWDVAHGRSWIARSKHQDGDGIDLCPYYVYNLHGPDKLQWDENDPVWNKMGAIAEAIGLRWGGRFHVPDLGHFELVPEGVTV